MGTPVVRLKNRKALSELFDSDNNVCASVVCLNGKSGYGKYLALSDYIQNINNGTDSLLYVEAIEIKDVTDIKYLLSCDLCVHNNYYNSEAPHKIFYLRGIEGFKIYDNIPNTAFISLLKLFKDHKNYIKLDRSSNISSRTGKRTKLNLSFAFTSSDIHIQPWSTLKSLCSPKGIVYINRPDLYSVKSLFNVADITVLERIYKKCDGNLHQIKIYLQLEIPLKVRKQLEDKLRLEAKEHLEYKKLKGINVKLREHKPRTIDEWLSNTNNLPPKDYDIASFFLGTAIDSPLKMHPETMDLESKLDFTRKAGNEFASAFVWENFITKSHTISYDGRQPRSCEKSLSNNDVRIQSMKRCSEIVDLFSFGNMLSTLEIGTQGYSESSTRNLYGIIYPSHLSRVPLSQNWDGFTSLASYNYPANKLGHTKKVLTGAGSHKSIHTINKGTTPISYFGKSVDGLQYSVLKFPVNLPLKPFRKVISGSYFTDIDVANPRNPLNAELIASYSGTVNKKSNSTKNRLKTTVHISAPVTLRRNNKGTGGETKETIQKVNVEERKEVYLGTDLTFEHLFCMSKILLKIAGSPVRSKVNKKQLCKMYIDWISVINTFFISKQITADSIELFSVDLLDTCIFDSMTTSNVRKKQIEALKHRFKCANESLNSEGIELTSLGVDNQFSADYIPMEIEDSSGETIHLGKRVKDDTFKNPPKKRDGNLQNKSKDN